MLGINKDPVTIKSIELAIVDRAFDEGWIVPEPPPTRTWKKVAVIGSGPAGLAAAAQLNRAGHSVTVFEKSDRIGGLLRYGIPEFKLEKRVLDRRLDLLAAEGVVFRAGVHVGVDVPADDLRRDFDAVLLAGGAGQPRDLTVPGRELDGVHFAMDFLTAAEPPLCRRRRRRGGGDLGRRQARGDHRRRRHRRRLPGHRASPGRASVAQLELLPTPPAERAADNPWPLWPHIFRTSSAHEEGGDRALRGGDDAFQRRRRRPGPRAARPACGQGASPTAGSASSRCPDRRSRCRPIWCCWRWDSSGPAKSRLLDDLDVRMTDRGTVWRDDRWMTSVPGVFAAGDMQRGQSLIVWAIDDGRHAAAAVDAYLAQA